MRTEAAFSNWQKRAMRARRRTSDDDGGGGEDNGEDGRWRGQRKRATERPQNRKTS